MRRDVLIPAPLLVLAAVFSVQLGATLAAMLIPRIGAGGSVLLRLGLSAALMLVVARPALRGHTRAAWRTVLAFGFTLGLMNFLFYSSLRYLPLGVAVTIEFIGPLTLAAILSRRLRDALAVAAAGGGVVLVSRAFEVPLAELSWIGLGLGLATGACWATYIVLSRRTGQEFRSVHGLTLALCIATVVIAPVGAPSVPSWTGADLLTGLGVAILSSVLPYSLELIALRRLTAHVFGILLSLEPAVGALAGRVVLGQRLSTQQIVGIALVVVASVLVLGVGARRPLDPAAATGD